MQFTFITLSPEDLRNVIREEIERAVRQPTKATAEPSAYFTLAQAVERYGVSKSYLYRLSSKREVSTRRVGKSVQFDSSELVAHFDKTAKRSQTAIDAELRTQGVFPTLKGKRRG